MTISIKSPTSTTGSIQKNGSDVLTIDSSDNVTVVNNLSVSGTVSSTGAITFDGGTISGNVNFDSGTLYVDATNNRVGIGTSSPSVRLDVVDSSRYTFNVGNSYTLQTSLNAAGSSFVDDYKNATQHIWQTSGTERMRIGSDGKIKINTTGNIRNIYEAVTLDYEGLGDGFVCGGPGAGLIVRKKGTGINQYICLWEYNSTIIGSITHSSGTSTSYNTTSDHRLKENNVNITDGITRVKQLNPYRFNFIAEPDTTVDGFYAHEVQSVVPEAITGTKDEVDDEGNPVYQGIDQSKLVPLLTAALQEAITKIEALETRIEALENPS